MLLERAKNWMGGRFRRGADKFVKVRKNLRSGNKFPNPLLNDLLDSGCAIVNDLFTPDQVKSWINDYGLESDNIKASINNLTIPVVNPDMIQAITDSPLSDLLDRYFHEAYGKTPILQTAPHLIVTKTDFDQSGFKSGEYRIPAVWHTDYPYELTVHFPITPIGPETTRTKFSKKSHRSYGVWPNFSDPNLSDEKVARRFEIQDCFADPGDALIMDVTGLHRAHLKESYRALIQLKYTSGNNLLPYDEKNFGWIYQKTLDHWKDKSKVLPSLNRDKELVEKTTFKPSHQIIKTYGRLYQQIAEL